MDMKRRYDWIKRGERTERKMRKVIKAERKGVEEKGGMRLLTFVFTLYL